MTRGRKRQPSRVGTASWVSCLLGLGFAFTSLAVIGPPPAFRIDALWVYLHQDGVRLALAGIAVALTATLVALWSRRHRWWLALVWLAAGGATAALFSDRIHLVTRVLVDHFR